LIGPVNVVAGHHIMGPGVLLLGMIPELGQPIHPIRVQNAVRVGYQPAFVAIRFCQKYNS
jgi:hypothetical protein